MMSALEVMNSLDSMLADVKQKYEEEIKTLKDQLLAAQIQGEMHRSRAGEAVRERDQYMRLATKLVAQFGTVEAVFAEAKNLALAHARQEQGSPPQVQTPTPEQLAAPMPTTTHTEATTQTQTPEQIAAEEFPNAPQT